MDDNTDAQQPGTAYAAPKSWRDEVQRLSQFANTAMDMSSRDQRNCLEYVAQRLADMLREDAIPTSADQQAAPGARITLDFKQAAALLKMFGAEPCEITLTDGDGHAGRGLYAHYTDMPEEGSTYLGVSADAAEPEAAPAAVAGSSISQVTEQMRAAGDHAWMTSDGVDSGRVFWAMLAAAPTTQPSPASQGDALSQAARDVLAERQRQISAEGWTPEHDDEHDLGQLARAAACYSGQSRLAGNPELSCGPTSLWPWHYSCWKPNSRRGMLVKAGALILAEMERLDRADANPQCNTANPEATRP